MARADLSENIKQITGILKDYLSDRVDLVKLGLLQRLTKVGVYLLTSITVIISLAAILIFLMFAFSFWYGDRTGSLDQGFLISAGFFVVLLLFVVIFRRAIFSGSLIKSFTSILFSDESENK